MISTIAFIMCFTFIVAGFIIEAKSRDKVTYAVWLPLVWMIICSSRSIDHWLNTIGFGFGRSAGSYYEANLEGSIVDQISLSIMIIWGIIIIYKRKETVIGLFKNNKALLTFTIYLGFTVLWSDIIDVSFRRWIRFAGNFVMATVLMTEPEPLESIKSIFRRTAYLLIPLSVMLIKYFPKIGVLYSRMGGQIWTGVALMKNALGHLCFVVLFFLVWDAISNWGRKVEKKFSRTLLDVTIMIMCLWLLTGSSSAASMGSIIFGMAVLFVSRVSAIKRSLGNIWFLVILAACIFLVLQSSFGIVELIVTSMGRNMTFTDRTPLWNALIDIGMRKPFWGYGYGGFWTPERVDMLWMMGGEAVGTLTQGHNGYLEVFVEGGLTGIILLGVLLISLLNKIQRNAVSNYEYTVFRLAFLGMILLANVTESSFAEGRDLLTFVFYIIALSDIALKENIPKLATTGVVH